MKMIAFPVRATRRKAFGDNDELSLLAGHNRQSRLASYCSRMSTGFYVPGGKRPRLLRTVRKLTPEMEEMCNSKGKLGTGGMRSKLRAAKLASDAGASVVIANGRAEQVIPLAMERKIGTYFPPLKKGSSNGD